MQTSLDLHQISTNDYQCFINICKKTEGYGLGVHTVASTEFATKTVVIKEGVNIHMFTFINDNLQKIYLDEHHPDAEIIFEL